MRTRIALGALGVLGIMFGAAMLLIEHDASEPLHLALWLAAAAIVNDLVLVPLVGIAGLALARVVPPRPRPYIQGGLIVAGLATVIAIPMIRRRGTQPEAKALLQQNYVLNLAIVIGLIAAVTAALIIASYVKAARSAENDRPASDHSSTI